MKVYVVSKEISFKHIISVQSDKKSNHLYSESQTRNAANDYFISFTINCIKVYKPGSRSCPHQL
jgi:hypothetical protein